MRGLVLLALLAVPVLAQAPGLTAAEAKVLDRLVAEALPRDPAYLQALADLESARQSLGLPGALSASAGAELSGVHEQVALAYRLSLSLDLSALFQDRSRALQAIEAKVESARREVRVRVAGAFFRYLAAREAARTAADGVEAREAELSALKARARVGSATPAEVLAGAERLSQARLALYRANLDLALALEELARVVGVSPEALKGLLKPLEEKGGTLPLGHPSAALLGGFRRVSGGGPWA
ncbi:MULTISPECIES: TolC family protein [Thermus]|uniref:TolC family protein n=1 Tax=Thermus thalpophilus TaxID=2908147 RepID=UPI001FA9E41F